MIDTVSYTYLLVELLTLKWYHFFIMHAPVQSTDLGGCGKLFF